MKRYLLAACIAFALGACKEETKEEPKQYTTDGLTLKEEKRPLLIQVYARGTQTQALYEVVRLSVEGSYPEMNTLSIGTADGDIFEQEFAEDLLVNFGAGIMPPAYLVEGEDVDLLDLPEAIEDLSNSTKKPMLAIDHKVTSNDTAWVVDTKLKFLKDTLSDGIFIETYLAADVPSVKNDIHDLRFPQINDLVNQGDTISRWAMNIPYYNDSTKFAVKSGDTYVHPAVLLDRYNKDSPWGTALSSYWSFGGVYSENDVIGTRYTPIRHYFNKEDIAEKYEFRFKPRLVTVVWILNPFSFQFEYVNSISTTLK